MTRLQSGKTDGVALPGWDLLRHGGLLFDAARLGELGRSLPRPLAPGVESRLRQRGQAVLEELGEAGSFVSFVSFVLEEVCGFTAASGTWWRGSRVPATEGRRAIAGELLKPRHLWTGRRGARLPVFFDDGKRLGIGKSRRSVSRAVEWLRAGGEPLALLTNGRQWRLLFAGLDYEAWCEWDLDTWFDGGSLGPQVTALRTLLSPELWTPGEEGGEAPLLRRIRESREGQAEVSEVLGERVRQAVEILIRGHGAPLRSVAAAPADIYRAACRVAMRLVVILYAESRELLPRENALYDRSYGLGSLRARLERTELAGGSLSDSFSAWPCVLALFRLVRKGSHHPELPVTAYGGDLFAPGGADSPDGLSRALSVFETACFEASPPLVPDREVHEILRLLTRTRVRIHQGRGKVRVAALVGFSDLSSEYIGVLYEGLLDYELKTAPPGDPVLFLPGGDQPALPLSRLEAMDDAALRRLFADAKNRSAEEGDEGTEEPDEGAVTPEDTSDPEGNADETGAAAADPSVRYRRRAETWGRRAVRVAGLAGKRRGRNTPERRLAFENEVGAAARRLTKSLVLPDEWYLARWGGTRKGSGSFYTRTGLAVPTVQRTLRPLAYDPPPGADGAPDREAPSPGWTPKKPEDILSLAVCDPACGSGAFPLAALRFLTEALYASLHYHGRIEPAGEERSLVRLLGVDDGERQPPDERLGDELIPCRPEDGDFEPRLKAVLRRYVVERCIYAVDLDPLAVELCRLSLWIETMDRELPFGFLDHKVKCGNSLVGAWFDSFRHYPAMAWKGRKGGDENHANGVHFEKGARMRALKAFVEERLKPGLRDLLTGRTLFREDLLAKASSAHDESQAALEALHALPVRDAAKRARRYREDFLGSPARQSLKAAMDLWCACWFWPADGLDSAPLPTSFADPPEATRAMAACLASEMRFFHWELEFPDVFREAGAGFDAVLGNPPWENLQPNPEEFFSDRDPLFRTYGRLEKVRTQRHLFQADQESEKQWLDYTARFNDLAHWVGNVVNPFGDPAGRTGNQKTVFSLGAGSSALHDRWRSGRARESGYADAEHPFRFQMGRIFTYKLFLEQSMVLIKDGGRCGCIIPSGLYSDFWSRPLRDFLLDRCRWEWLFGIENRDRVFPIHRSYKFNPVIVEKGGETAAIRTAFMRRNLDDWARAEELILVYTRAQIERFSPESRILLEIQSKREFELLDKIYSNSVLLGSDEPEGWNINYDIEFMMNTHAHLFPPRPQWEAKGYRPDEYSRWLLGDWRPIGELWAELGVDPSRPEPPAIELEDWLFDHDADPERREAEARFVHGHLLKPGDLARTGGSLRCAQSPYDRLPIPRANIPDGVILSREGDAWIREDKIGDVALPLYEGRMIGQFDPSQKGWVSGKARSAVWDDIPWNHKQIQPQYLMSRNDNFASLETSVVSQKVAMMSIASSTNTRTMISVPLQGLPCGNSVGVLRCIRHEHCLPLSAALNSFAYDFCLRKQLPGLNMNYFLIEDTPLPRPRTGELVHSAPWLFDLMPGEGALSLPSLNRALAKHERLRLRCILDVLMFSAFRMDLDDVRHVLGQCDFPRSSISSASSGGRLDAKGFWRVDKDRDPELRHTVLTLIAFHDLEAKIAAAGGNREHGIRAFLAQNDEGWMLPETLRLADYGLGHDERANRPQPVASRLGPRFYDWQLVQSATEARRERHRHARNLFGPAAAEPGSPSRFAAPPEAEELPQAAEPAAAYRAPSPKKTRSPNLFE